MAADFGYTALATMRESRLGWALVSAGVGLGLLLPPAGISQEVDEGQRLYELACSGCHGTDGVGAARDQVAFDTPLPDFSDCSFSSREPDADWVAIAHQGGPVRAFDETMPAFGEALSEEQSNLTFALFPARTSTTGINVM